MIQIKRLLKIYASCIWFPLINASLFGNCYTPEIDQDCNTIIAAKADPITVAPIFARTATLEDRLSLNGCVQERGNISILPDTYRFQRSGNEYQTLIYALLRPVNDFLSMYLMCSILDKFDLYVVSMVLANVQDRKNFTDTFKEVTTEDYFSVFNSQKDDVQNITYSIMRIERDPEPPTPCTDPTAPAPSVGNPSADAVMLHSNEKNWDTIDGRQPLQTILMFRSFDYIRQVDEQYYHITQDKDHLEIPISKIDSLFPAFSLSYLDFYALDSTNVYALELSLNINKQDWCLWIFVFSYHQSDLCKIDRLYQDKNNKESLMEKLNKEKKADPAFIKLMTGILDRLKCPAN